MAAVCQKDEGARIEGPVGRMAALGLGTSGLKAELLQRLLEALQPARPAQAEDNASADEEDNHEWKVKRIY